MRPLCLLFALVFAPLATDAQSTEGLVLLLDASDEIDDSTPFCPPSSATEWLIVGAAVACGAGLMIWFESYIQGSCVCTDARPRPAGKDPADVLTLAGRSGTLSRRGVGLVDARQPVRVRVLDAETRQPVALGPLGSTTATVRSAADLRALLSDR